MELWRASLYSLIQKLEIEDLHCHKEIVNPICISILEDKILIFVEIQHNKQYYFSKCGLYY